MVFPYRTLASIEPDLPFSLCPSPYRGPGQCAGCSRWAAGSPLVYAEIAAGLGVWLKAVCAAGVFFLGAASTAVLMVGLRAGAPRGGHPRGDLAPVTSVATAAAASAPKRKAPAREATATTRPAAEGGAALLNLHVLGPVTHAPEDLWARAENLVRAGFDVVLTETRIAEHRVEELERDIQPAVRILPSPGGAGVEIASIAPGALPWSVGLSRGDVVTAVNGYALAAPEAALEAYVSVRERGSAVIEVVRGGRPVVLKVSLAR